MDGLTGLLKTLDSIVRLNKSKKETNRNLFEKFVQPAKDELDAIHKNYLESFAHYLEIAQTINGPMDLSHPLITVILKDKILSSDSRVRIYSFYDSTNDVQLDEFIKSISDYFQFSESSWGGSSGTGRTGTLNAIITLIRNPQTPLDSLQLLQEGTYKRHLTQTIYPPIEYAKSPKEAIITLIQQVIEGLTIGYRRINDRYNSLKIELLK